MVLENGDYDCILRRAQTLSIEEKKGMEQHEKTHSNDRMEASNARKREMQELEFRRRRTEKPSDLEQVSLVCHWSLIDWSIEGLVDPA